MPLPIQRYDDPFLPFSKVIIEVTRDLVCGYVFDLAAYLAIGAAGAVALERSIAYARADGETISILHAPFASGDYATAAGDTAFCVDGVTLTADAPAAPYLALPGMGVYVVDGKVSTLGRYDVTDGVLYTSSETGLPTIYVLRDDIYYPGRGEAFAEVMRIAVVRKLDEMRKL